ncbi:hypothetical protein HWV62_18246 [Athelia sp. TMB]|nr:hypothetical protein HWV62_18246 [Athelia sp. TMB]
MSGHQNPGWPGCCRPPNPNEQRLISPADWPAVSIIHSVPIPPDIKIVLDSLTQGKLPGSPMGAPQRNPIMPLMDRRNSSTTSLNRISPSSKNPPMTIPSKGRSGGSPQLPSSNLMKPDKTSGMAPSSFTNVSPLDQRPITSRRQSIDQGEKARSPSSRNSPSRKPSDLEGSLPRRSSSSRRPTITAATAPSSLNKGSISSPTDVPGSPPPLRHRASTSSPTLNSKPSPPNSRTGQSATIASRSQTRRPSLEVAMAAVNISSASSSSGSSDGGSSRGSMSDSTVTSDGGFTDYLSDESEAELQRQAEVKAAIFAQNQAEEQEFKAARQQLAHVDLRPPKSWNPTSSGSVRIGGGSINAAIAAYAQTMAQAGTASRV